MNRAILLIAIPALLVSIFWLTIGWGWRTALAGACVELAIAIAVINYLTRRKSAPPDPGSGGPTNRA